MGSEARGVYVSPSRPTLPPRPESEPALTMGRGQPVVLQLRGPGTAELRAWPLAAMPEDREPLAQLRLRWLGPELGSTPEGGGAAAAAGPVPGTVPSARSGRRSSAC